MSLLDQNDAQALREKFANELTRPVTLRFYTMGAAPLIVPGRECVTCEDTETILTELSELSDQIALERHDFYKEAEAARDAGIARIPATVVAADGTERTVLYGMPAGYEFATLVQTVLNVSKGSGDLSADTVKALAGVATPVHLQVFVTPT